MPTASGRLEIIALRIPEASGAVAMLRTGNGRSVLHKGIKIAAVKTIQVPDPELFNPQSGRLDAALIVRGLNVPFVTIAGAI
jgi:hypothetical protein